MILCYEGTPGSGKSYDAVKKIIDNLKLGRVVYTNIDGMGDADCREFIKVLTGLDDFDLANKLFYYHPNDVHNVYPTIKHNAFLVIDEAHKWFNARNYQDPKNKAFADWCSTQRHFGYDVLLITQDIGKIDSQVRTNIEWTYRYKKINFFGKLISNSYTCNVFQEDASGKPLRNVKKSYDKNIFRCYRSYVTKQIKEQGIQPNINILKHPIFYAIPLLLVVFFYFFSKSGFAKGNIIPGGAKAVEMTSSAPAGLDASAASDVSVSSPVASALDVKPLDAVASVASSAEIVSPVPASALDSYVVIGFIADTASPENGFFYYRPLKGSVNIRMRASKVAFDSLCKCNSTARLQAGDIIDF